MNNNKTDETDLVELTMLKSLGYDSQEKIDELLSKNICSKDNYKRWSEIIKNRTDTPSEKSKTSNFVTNRDKEHLETTINWIKQHTAQLFPKISEEERREILYAQDDAIKALQKYIKVACIKEINL